MVILLILDLPELISFVTDAVIFLSFWAEVHYNSIYCQGDPPSVEVPRKKKWWILTQYQLKENTDCTWVLI
ncbi:hypothetical protein HRI_004285900 [Hibiscus trionum]|uniref:Uncharacterized protein n=1 Tax=Hibiscus trionum TaxID=183268 RepID=A0A9W7J3V5_HIBTR|nr:hypothetical protein HRI_004285900 [Hibiscus trionum]